MLSVKNLSLKFTKEFYALENINLEIDDGESVAFVGESNSGKTTLLRVLAKLEDFDSGEIYFNHIPIKNVSY